MAEKSLNGIETTKKPRTKPIQPWKAIEELSQTPKTWEQMEFKTIDEKEIRLVDVYKIRAGSEMENRFDESIMELYQQISNLIYSKDNRPQ